MAAQLVVAMTTSLTNNYRNCMVCCVLSVIGWEMSDACHAEQEYPPDG